MKLYNKYRPPPKVNKSSNSTVRPSTSLSNVAGGSRGIAQEDTDSSSSDVENFVNPNELDLGSEFFGNACATGPVEAPNFDCNAGVHMSGSSSDASDEETQTQAKAGSSSDLNQFHEYNKKLERAKSQMTRVKFTPTTDGHKLPATSDINALLSMGEASALPHTKPVPKKAKRSKKDHNDSDDSDWEEVEGKR